MSETTHHSTFRLVLGLGLVAAGVLFTLSNLGIVDTDQWVPWWPALLVVYGLLRIIGVWCRPAWITGSLFVVGGTWWLLHNLGVLPFDVWQLWPLIFIFMGIGVMRRRYWSRYIAGIGYVGVSSRRRWRRFGEADIVGGAPESFGGGASGGASPGDATGGGASAGDTGSAAGFGPVGSYFRWRGTGSHAADQDGVLRVDVFLSSVSRRVTSQQFKGGEVVAVMGGGELDLREAKLAEGRARLEMNLIMGGITLRVPEDWAVEFQGTPIMGGFEDQTRRQAGEPRGRLIVTGVLLLSGILLKN